MFTHACIKVFTYYVICFPIIFITFTLFFIIFIVFFSSILLLPLFLLDLPFSSSPLFFSFSILRNLMWAYLLVICSFHLFFHFHHLFILFLNFIISFIIDNSLSALFFWPRGIPVCVWDWVWDWDWISFSTSSDQSSILAAGPYDSNWFSSSSVSTVLSRVSNNTSLFWPDLTYFALMKEASILFSFWYLSVDQLTCILIFVAALACPCTTMQDMVLKGSLNLLVSTHVPHPLHLLLNMENNLLCRHNVTWRHII